MRPAAFALYGLIVASDLDLPDARESDGPVDVTIRPGAVPAHLDRPLVSEPVFEASSSQFLLKIGGVARFLIEDHAVVVDADPSAHPSDVEAFLGSILAIICHRRGWLVLHASSVMTPSGAVVFIGYAGQGKSTLTAELCRRGHPLVTDDLAVVALDADGDPVVHSGPNHLKLWKDAVQRLGRSDDSLRKVRPQLEKFYVPVTGVRAAPAPPLAAVVVLDPTPADEVELVAVRGAECFNLLRGHVRLRRAMEIVGQTQAQFALLSKVARDVPMWLLRRPKDGDTVSRLADAVETLLVS